MNKKIIRVTVDLVVDESVDTESLVQETDYYFIPMNDEVIHETKIINYEELSY